jgi:hypothetical protein
VTDDTRNYLDFIYLISKHLGLDSNYIENMEVVEYKYYCDKVKDYIKK